MRQTIAILVLNTVIQMHESYIYIYIYILFLVLLFHLNISTVKKAVVLKLLKINVFLYIRVTSVCSFSPVLLKFPFGKVSSVFAGFSLPYLALQPYMLCRFCITCRSSGKQRSIIRQQILR